MQALHLRMVPGLHQWIACSHAGTLYLPQKYHYVVPQGTMSVYFSTLCGKGPSRLECTRLASWRVLKHSYNPVPATCAILRYTMSFAEQASMVVCDPLYVAYR